MDVLISLLGMAGCNYITDVPGTDDIMPNQAGTPLTTYLRFDTSSR